MMTTDDGSNVTTILTTFTTEVAPTVAHIGLYSNNKRFILAGVLMTLGIIGNTLALIILARKKGTKNSKYNLMLKFLATNNLIALVGMVTKMLLNVYLPEEVFIAHKRWDCASYLVPRFFGVNSGCIAAVMAVERWMALARPFIYHKHITYELVRKSIHSLTLIAVVITVLPLFGFGAYIDESRPGNPICIRYRDAEGAWNKAYAVIFMLFGTLLCVVIVASNLFVARVLCFIGRSRTAKRHMHYDLVNREKGHTVDGDSNSGSSLYHHHSNSVTMTAASSPNEIKFAKLMAFLSISFVICWMPQMIATLLAIMPNRVDINHKYFLIADALMALHFTSDPYIYVVSRSKQSYLLCFAKKRWRCGLKRSQSDQSRFRTTTTVEQNTLDCGLN